MPHAPRQAAPRGRPHGGPTLPRLAAGSAAVAALTLLPGARLGAPHRVTGRVTSAAGGQPVPEVTVRVKGGTAGTRTDSAGRYVITARTPNDTLLLNRVGFIARQEPVAGRDAVNVQLAGAPRSLEQVVVIGFGQKQRATLTESVGTVSAEQIRQVPIASADQAIQGRVPGVQVTSASGTPGSPVSVRIRGVSTVGNTQPLFVVDGVPVGRGADPRTNPLTTIDPADIESISVLKDASSAAVYGVQAANGVVLITTKRGVTGRPSVRYDTYAGLQRVGKLWDMNDTRAYVSLQEEANANFNAQNNLRPTDKDYRTLHPDLRAGSRYLGVNTDFLGDALRQNAPITNHNLSVSGATPQLSYHVSGGYFSQAAVSDRWDLNRVSFRANSDYNINSALRFGETFTASYQRVLRGMNGGGDGYLLRGRLNQARVYLSGTNLFTLTGYSGLDPEVQTWGADEFGVGLSANQLRAGTDFGNILQPRVFQFGLTVGF